MQLRTLFVHNRLTGKGKKLVKKVAKKSTER